ncbi:probable leucine-rich repeat receptor-like serine/threonine-protein kinase At3g14840 isoform X2 [Pyrus x bretschneideri]|uniref:probable leucine-rich repeat receptor-like serine/threonine-protein kinase At3g14840 isoform X2 n=1 Tax=Pyrus x bretschneideri TaxID=225117 RepID=UPI002030AA02|nr:probable leucine-rich repeat receptor-like serine/threonine-protein kinase At3g14840 isoform X2 [Pyrus x bretschneideri]
MPKFVKKIMMNMFFPRLLLHSLLVVCFAALAFGAARLPQDEVQALADIAKTLGKTDWDFSVDPCSGQLPWTNISAVRGFESAVTCNCSFDDSTVCHVTSIVLKTQELPGTLPREMVRLKYLQEIDLTRNYLNGTIPPEWGSLRLVNISLIGNRLTGPIPVEFANITTLRSLDLSSNFLSEPLPEELGNFPHMERMLLSSNKFTGYLPDSFANLITLKDFRIGDTNFSGEIPKFIEKWTNLEKLVIQGSGLTGKIPGGISLLTSLTDLRITDLIGPELNFPQLDNMKNMRTLMLRSCNIIGGLPPYLGQMPKLNTLDLSYNKLTGEIPPSFASLANVDYIFLTGNLLTGPVPTWSKKIVDLSFNNLTIGNTSCQPRVGLNLFDSNSSGVSCSTAAKCPKTMYSSFHINCGGKEVTIENTTYEDDTFSAEASSFYQSGTNWALSSTGYFPDDDQITDIFIMNNVTRLSMADPQLYMNARVSPISLTYFGFCLQNGIYTVKLHFAELMFRSGDTYKSLGRRVFDIYIQDIQALQNFNIMDDARVFGNPVIQNFTANVTNHTLKIHFNWAGKGTTGIPVRGVYGPLISAISVEPAVDNSSTKNGSSISPGVNGVSVGAVVGIVAGGIFIILVILSVLWRRGSLGQQKTLEDDLKGVDLQTGKFTFKQLKAATTNFDKANKIGEGGFGSVYKGILADGTMIAVKQLSSKSKQGNREFVNEIGMISALQHPHLVSLYGCCIEGNQLLLVYEYMENNSVAHALFGAGESRLKLDWPTRHKICVGIARGLAHLHEESRLKVVHRDIKATNVLLDKNLNPKISDFGLAKLDEEDNTHISTRIAGTFGYMAPEYAMRGYLTDKADVYSFGILVLEIVSGRNNTSYRTKAECFYLLDWATLLKAQGNLLDLVDPRLGSNFNKKEMMVTINVALLCSSVTSAVRPTMSSVVSMLEGRVVVQELVSDPNPSSNEIDAMRNHFQSYLEGSAGESQIQTESIEEPRTISYASGHDLYPVNPDSNYRENVNKRNWETV